MCSLIIFVLNTSQVFFSNMPIYDILETEAEVEAVKRVTETVCPLRIVLDRVVLTSTGVLLGLWQVWIFIAPYSVCKLKSWASIIFLIAIVVKLR
jgi:hypothetical protein